MKKYSLFTFVAPWALILVGISATIFIPTFIAIATYSINQNLTSVIEEYLQDTAENQTNRISQFESNESYQNIISNTNIIESAIAFSPSLSSIPVLNQEIFAWKLETKRLLANLRNGIILIESSINLFNLMQTINTVSTSPNPSSYNMEIEKSNMAGLKTSLSSSLSDMNNHKTLSQRHPPIFSPSRYLYKKFELESSETRIFNTVSVIYTLTEIISGYISILELSQPFNNILYESGTQEDIASEDLLASLNSISNDSYLLQIKTHGLLSSVENIDVYNKSSIEDVLLLFAILFESLEALSLPLEVLISSIEFVNTTDDNIKNQQTIFGVLQTINNHHAILLENLKKIETIESKIHESKSHFTNSNLITYIELLGSRINRVKDGIQILTDIAPIAEKILNSPDTTRYLILGHSSDELRATGGFISSLWIIEFEKGQNIQTRYYDTVRVDDWNKLELYPPPPDGLKKHMNAHVWLLRDVSWEPDFPTTANIATDMFYLGQNIRVDGVIGINQWALMKLIESIGDIKSPSGDLITPLNFLSKIEDGTDKYGRAYTDLVLDGFIEKIFYFNSADINFFFSTANDVKKLLDAKEISIFSFDPDIQNTISDKGWDGQIKSSLGDYLLVIDSNVGWSKSDRNIERQTNYEIDLSKDPPRANLTLRYFNHSGSGSVPCDPQWVNRGTNYDQLKNACYWNYWRVYTPNNTDILSHTPMPIKDFSVAAQVGFESVGTDSFHIESLYGYNIFSGLSSTEAGDSELINLVYDLPKKILKLQENTIEYSLLIQKQSGVRKRPTEIKVILPEKYRLKSSNIFPSDKNKNHIFFELQLTEDTTIDMTFEKIP